MITKLLKLIGRKGMPPPREAAPGSGPMSIPMDRMQKIKLRKGFGDLPSGDMKEFTRRVNSKIDQFNNSSNATEKEALLREIQKEIETIDHKYPPSYLASSKGYRAVHDALFLDIKKQMELLGIHSLRSPEAKALPVTEVIENMSPKKAEKLTAILAKGSKDSTATLQQKLNELYPEEDKSSEAESFRDFLRTHQITFLGGGNSRNFSVKNLTDNSTFVLKVDNRLDMPKNIEAHLRGNLPEQFAPIHAERQITFENTKGKTISRTLQVTDLCTGGSVREYGRMAENDEQLVSRAFGVFDQMSGTMLAIQNQGCVFPDAKLTNWLVDQDGRLVLADTKSFLFTGPNGYYPVHLPGNEYTGLLCTGGFAPPEFISEGAMVADSAHAYILGKNLYAFLAGTYAEGDSGDQFDFSAPVFNTRKGAELKQLICDLVKPDAASRMSIKDANERLLEIREQEVLFELESLSIGSNDTTMEQFITEKRQQLESVKDNPAERKAIIKELEDTVASLRADPVSKEIQNIVDNYRQNAGLLTMGMNAKADRIERAMVNVPIAERTKLVDSPTGKPVMQALASHRNLGKQGEVYYKSGTNELDTDKAATTYKNFKSRFIDQKAQITADPSSAQDDVVSEVPGVKMK